VSRLSALALPPLPPERPPLLTVRGFCYICCSAADASKASAASFVVASGSRGGTVGAQRGKGVIRLSIWGHKFCRIGSILQYPQVSELKPEITENPITKRHGGSNRARFEEAAPLSIPTGHLEPWERGLEGSWGSVGSFRPK